MGKHFSYLYLTDHYLGEALIVRYSGALDYNYYFKKLKKDIQDYCHNFSQIKKIVIGEDAILLDFLAFLIDEVFIKEKIKADFNVFLDPLINPLEIYDFNKAEAIYHEKKDFVKFIDFYLTNPIFEDTTILEPREQVEKRVKKFTSNLNQYFTDLLEKSENKVLVIFPEELLVIFLKIFKVLPLLNIKSNVYSLIIYDSRDNGNKIYDLEIKETRRKILPLREIIN